MNYVGCKGWIKTHQISRAQMFYMNYVGCKVLFAIKLMQSKPSFYMNYVGCKVYMQCQALHDWKGFIWTMWDVKWGVIQIIK